ncbi:hypothetical protein ACHAXA_010206 [Cyclostephanos tholiformis]|uniref:Uncharacterized protein n=1 Tax=Cyclostephanos tholiformis TaxID=382380 RepID=A0ABD3SFW3_9STRA
MSTSRLRRPNFNLLPFVPTASSSSSSPNNAPPPSFSRVAIAAGSATTTTAAAAGASAPPSSSASRQLARYARLCHERMLLNCDDQVDDDAEDQAGDDSRRRGGGGGGDDDYAGKRRSEEGPSMERCIALLEPILGSFRSYCIAKDEERARRLKKNGRSEGDGCDEICGDGEDDGDEDDEVPPQLTRVARFFPHRFMPMRRALLRPPAPPGDDDDEDGGCVVELAMHYRLRLVRACRRKGLVADAEYEMLSRSFDRARGKRRGRRDDSDNDDDDDNVQSTKRHKAESETNGRRDDDEDLDDDAALMERVRLSLMRLPADVVSLSSSSSRGRSTAAWRHVVELLSRCCSRWEEDDRARRDDNNNRRIVSPDKVADWAMTSWTAMLLLRGFPNRFVPLRRAQVGIGGDIVDHRGGCLDHIEGRLAALLSDRRDIDVSGARSTSTTVVARAVGRRIDSLLSPANISSLNGIHLYSLGRLMASFRVRDDAIMHIASSIWRCGEAAAMGSGRGSGGVELVGLEPLSRLLAVYTWCRFASSPSSTSVTTTRSTSSTVRDLEIGLRAKLEDDSFVRTIVVERSGGVDVDDLRAADKMVQQKHSPAVLYSVAIHGGGDGNNNVSSSRDGTTGAKLVAAGISSSSLMPFFFLLSDLDDAADDDKAAAGSIGAFLEKKEKRFF